MLACKQINHEPKLQSMTTPFLALRVDNTAGKTSAGIQSLGIDDLPSGEVLIRADYSSVNYKDALAVTGAGKIIRHFPLTAGIDVAGHVQESTAAGFNEGDAVLVTGYDLGVAHDGGYAGYVRVPAAWVEPIPRPLTPYLAMVLGTAGLTAALCIHRLQQNGHKPEHGPFVISGATGGVGSIAINILSRLGYHIVALTGKTEESDWLMQLGAKQIMDRHSISNEHDPLQKGRWGGAIDNVGGAVLAWLLSGTKPWGHIVSVGLAGGHALQTTVLPFILRGVSVLGVTASACPAILRRQLWQRLASDLMPDKIDHIVNEVVSLEQLPAVCASTLAGKRKGRTVVRLAD